MSDNMPPKDISPQDLWTEITRIPRPHRIVDFPRKGPDGKPVAQIAMMVLTQEESMLSTSNTEKWVRKVMKDEGSLPNKGEPDTGYSVLFQNRAVMEVLFRSSKRVDDLTKPFFPTVATMAEKLTTDEISVLSMSYLRVQAELGPIASDMDEDTIEAWIETLAIGGSAIPLGGLSLAAQSQLMLSMASRLWRSRTVKG